MSVMDIELRINIEDSRMSDGLLAAMDTINEINEADDDSVTLDFSKVKFVTPLFVLPLVVFLTVAPKMWQSSI